jgi:hypothetical protein
MNEAEVRKRAFAMPLTSPAYPPGPYVFVNRAFFIIAYRTDPDCRGDAVLRRVPEQRVHRPVHGRQPRLVHAMKPSARSLGHNGIERRRLQ